MDDRPIILIPTKDDHEALGPFTAALRAALADAGVQARLVIVDDGSRTRVTADALAHEEPAAQSVVSVIRLRRNLGHQRAIAVGLAYIADRLQARRVVVMDGDGEDRAEDVPRLLAELDRSPTPCVVFAERTRRSESVVFQAGYHAFRLLHRLLTGIPVRFGNFSALQTDLLPTLVVGSELWNHYAAAVLKLGLPVRSIPTVRGRRIAGRPRMNLVGLVVHGLSAISVFGEIVGVRLLMVAAAMALFLVGVLASFTVVALTTASNLAAWVAALVGAALVLVAQLGLVVLGFVFIVLGSRASTSVIPLRDYRWFVEESDRPPGAATGPAE